MPKTIVSMSQEELERKVEERLAALSTTAPATPINTRGADPAQPEPRGSAWRGSVNPNQRRESQLKAEDAVQIMSYFRGVLEQDGNAVRGALAKLGYRANEPQSVGVSADGGYGVPEQFVSEVLIDLPRVTPFADPNIVRIVPMASETMRWTKVVNRPAEPPHVAEGAAYTKTKVTFAPLTLVAKKVGEIIPFTEEVIGSNQIGMVQVIAELVADAFAFKYNSLVTNGLGDANEPEGVTTNPDIAAVPLDDTDDQTYADSLIDGFYALPSQYRNDPNVIWMLTDTKVAEVRKLKDLNGRYIWTDGFGSAPPTLLGKRVFENPEVAETKILFGNFKRGYIIGKKEGMTTDRNSSGSDWEKDIVNFKFRERWDGRVHDTNAFVILDEDA